MDIAIKLLLFFWAISLIIAVIYIANANEAAQAEFERAERYKRKLKELKGDSK